MHCHRLSSRATRSAPCAMPPSATRPLRHALCAMPHALCALPHALPQACPVGRPAGGPYRPRRPPPPIPAAAASDGGRRRHASRDGTVPSSTIESIPDRAGSPDWHSLAPSDTGPVVLFAFFAIFCGNRQAHDLWGCSTCGEGGDRVRRVFAAKERKERKDRSPKPLSGLQLRPPVRRRVPEAQKGSPARPYPKPVAVECLSIQSRRTAAQPKVAGPPAWRSPWRSRVPVRRARARRSRPYGVRMPPPRESSSMIVVRDGPESRGCWRRLRAGGWQRKGEACVSWQIPEVPER